MSYPLAIIGGASRDRTDDLLTASQALSQLSYSPFMSINLLGRKVEISLTGFNFHVNKKQLILRRYIPYFLLMKVRFVMY